MSRAYRIRVKESLTRSLTTSDEITCELEMIEVLPADQMADLLKRELQQRGFENDGTNVSRQDGDIKVTVNPATGEVSVKAEARDTFRQELEREGRGYDDVGPNSDALRKSLSKDIQQDLEKRAQQETSRLQGQATEALEKHLCGLQQELDQAVNRVTAEALKQKAATMGAIKEISEDQQSGSLTITLEV
jgi:hypothetical protein